VLRGGDALFVPDALLVPFERNHLPSSSFSSSSSASTAAIASSSSSSSVSTPSFTSAYVLTSASTSSSASAFSSSSSRHGRCTGMCMCMEDLFKSGGYQTWCKVRPSSSALPTRRRLTLRLADSRKISKSVSHCVKLLTLHHRTFEILFAMIAHMLSLAREISMLVMRRMCRWKSRWDVCVCVCVYNIYNVCVCVCVCVKCVCFHLYL